ncbi:hypothetical protein C8F01DRAFT_1080806 [Mycena amicta]|nr:hypothetical protein C8F01DRAFT_1080806 [Mycena amicta]
MLEEDAIARLSLRDRREYRKFVFPESVADPTHDPFFSLEHASSWITSRGLQLFLSWDDSELHAFDVELIPGDELMDYRSEILPDTYIAHPFFSLDNAATWRTRHLFTVMLNLLGVVPPPALIPPPVPIPWLFQLVPPSRTSSRTSRFPSSAGDSPPYSRAASVASSAVSRLGPRRRSMSMDSAPSRHASFAAQSSRDRRSLSMDSIAERTVSSVRRKETEAGVSRGRKAAKGKQKENNTGFKLTREERVERIIDITAIPPTWSIPRDSAVYRLVLPDQTVLLPKGKRKNEKQLTIDARIKREDQDSWAGGGSGGHSRGDVWVTGFSDDLAVEVWCRRASHYCGGVSVCELVPEELFADCERYDVEIEPMRDLWNHELDANEREAISVGSILLRFYARVTSATCKKKDCSGHPRMVLLSHVCFVVAAEWKREERFEHIYIPLPANLDEQAFKYVFDNQGQLPEGMSVQDSDTCFLTVHPRFQMTHCDFNLAYGHSLDGRIKAAKMVRRPCDAEMVIFVPAPYKGVPPPSWLDNMALILFRRFHNHPAHPHTKPSIEEEHRLQSVVAAIGVEGLTVQKLLNHPLTLAEYNGERLGKVIPAFADSRRVKDFITAEAQSKYPRGMGWEGVLHHMTATQHALEEGDRYIYAAMSKDDFRLVVTMHPGLAKFIHRVTALFIDFTFKRIAGDMDEWEVAAFVDRYNQRISFGSLYCDRKTTRAFFQLFVELFDVIKRVTGTELGLRPFRPAANCRTIVMDGEAAQALGLGEFLVQYNDPQQSNIHSRDPVELVSNIDELPKTIPKSVIATLKSFPGLATMEAIEGWHQFCNEQPEEVVHNWYINKCNHRWYLPSLNKLLSKINPDDYDLTPNNTNIVETAHAGLNAETSIGLPLLSGILETQRYANRKHDELLQIENGGTSAVMPKRWNKLAHREKSAAQRSVSGMKKTAVRTMNIAEYEALQQERKAGEDERKASLVGLPTVTVSVRVYWP